MTVFINVVSLVVYLVGFVVCARKAYDWNCREFPGETAKIGPGVGYIMLLAGLVWPFLALSKGFAWLLTIGKR